MIGLVNKVVLLCVVPFLFGLPAKAGGPEGRYDSYEGLVMAEIELSDPDEPFDRPDWLGEEVTGDHRYYNSSLARHPFKTWSTGL